MGQRKNFQCCKRKKTSRNDFRIDESAGLQSEVALCSPRDSGLRTGKTSPCGAKLAAPSKFLLDNLSIRLDVIFLTLSGW
jgi:hypothetical protein